jgi:hypothetical protein
MELDFGLVYSRRLTSREHTCNQTFNPGEIVGSVDIITKCTIVTCEDSLQLPDFCIADGIASSTGTGS